MAPSRPRTTKPATSTAAPARATREAISRQPTLRNFLNQISRTKLGRISAMPKAGMKKFTM